MVVFGTSGPRVCHHKVSVGTACGTTALVNSSLQGRRDVFSTLDAPVCLFVWYPRRKEFMTEAEMGGVNWVVDRKVGCRLPSHAGAEASGEWVCVRKRGGGAGGNRPKGPVRQGLLYYIGNEVIG